MIEVKEELPSAARALKLDLSTRELRTGEELETILAALRKERPDGLYAYGGPLMNTYQNRIVGFALSNRLASVYDRGEAVAAGGLMSYGADQVDSYRRIASYIEKIQKGAKPSELPVLQPTRFELVINLSVAKALGLTIPPMLLARADEVIE